MKAISTVIFLVLCLLDSWAGNGVDSLKAELKKQSSQDIYRVDLLNQLSYEYWIIDPVQSQKYGQEALELAKTLNYVGGSAYAHRSVGVAHWAQGNYEEGLDFLMQSLVGYQSIGDTLNIANVMMNTGLIYSEQGSYEEALGYYEEAYTTFKALNKPERQINTANHIGELYQSQKQFQKAFEYYKIALELSDSLNYAYGTATAYLNMGGLYKDQGELDSALIYCEQALAIQTDNDDWHGRASSLYTMGTVHILKQNYKTAEAKLSESLTKAVRVSSKKLRRDVYLKLKEVASLQDEPKKALGYFEKYVVLNDSLLNAEKLRDFVRLENKFALEKKEREFKLQEQELVLLQQEAKIQNFFRNGLLIGLFVVLVIAYLVFSRQRLRIKKDKELLTKENEIHRYNEELAKVELENSKLKEKELTRKLEYKNKELTSYAINFVQKNELIEEINHTIDELKKSKDSETLKRLNSLRRLTANSIHIDKDWQDFKRHFEEVHTDFFKILKEHCPDITNNELKLCALLKLNMNLKEAAGIMGISPESVKTARYRLRKKLDLSRDENLIDYIINLEQELAD